MPSMYWVCLVDPLCALDSLQVMQLLFCSYSKRTTSNIIGRESLDIVYVGR